MGHAKVIPGLPLQDNTGYDLKQLFIGAEGTLGVVTAVAILCPPASASKQLMYLACLDFANLQKACFAPKQCLTCLCIWL